MSRKHFKALAEELRTIKPQTTQRERFAMWLIAVDAACATCRQFNARFNADRFRTACGCN